MTQEIPTADIEFASSLKEPLASWWWDNVIGTDGCGHDNPYAFYVYISLGTSCWWCDQAKGLLEATGSPYVVRFAHASNFPYPTVPQVFFGRRHIGGFEALARMLNTAGRVALFEKAYDDAVIPLPASEEAAGYDVSAYIPADTTHGGRQIGIPAGCRAMIGTGFRVTVPMGTYGRLAPRSGLATKYGAQVLAGVIDRDYRGEVKVILRVDEPLLINHGDRIAQLIFEVRRTAQVVVTKLDDTARGEGGFGSTGR